MNANTEASAVAMQHVNPADMLSQVVSDVHDKKASVQAMDAEVQQMQSELIAAQQAGDERKVAILEATLASSIEKSKQRTRDINELALGLKVYFEHLGTNISSLDQLTSEEESLLSHAQAAVEEAQEELDDLKDAWFFKESRQSSAQEKLDTAHAALKETEEKVKKMQRDRILEADLEQTLQTIQAAAAESISVLETNRTSLAEQINVLSSEQDFNSAEMKRLSSELDAVTLTHEDLSSRLREAEMELEDCSPGTPEYAQQNEKVTAVRNELQETEIQKNELLAALQKQEKYCEDLEVYLQSQRKLMSTNRTMTEMLKQEVHQGSKLFTSWLESKKQATALEAADSINTMTTDVRLNAAQDVAEMGAAADKALTKALESQSSVMEIMLTIKDGSQEAAAQMNKRQKAIQDDMAEKYGIDPTKGMFHTHNV